MDKARAKKRQQKQSDCNGKLKSSNQDCEMVGGQGSDSQTEDEKIHRRMPQSKVGNKKIKLHSKSLVNRSAVDPAKVPRKLRSAIIKRGHESLSPPLLHVKKPIHASVRIEATRSSRNYLKKDVQVSGPITKDEEEVAETLFSLARMLPEEKHVKRRVHQKSLDEKSSLMQDNNNNESPHIVSEDPKAESTLSQLTTPAAEHTNPSSNSHGSSKQHPYSGLPIMGRPIGCGNNRFNLDIASSGSLADLMRTSLPHANGNAIPLVDPSELGVSPEFCHLTGPVQQTLYEVSLHGKKLDRGLLPVLHAMEKGPQQSVLRHKASDPLLALPGAPYMWPGMYRVQSCGGEVCGPSSWPSSIKLPPWMVSATSSGKTEPTETGVLKEKVKPSTVDVGQPLKRCATHVHISRLIRAHQTSEKKPWWTVSPGHHNLNESTIHLGGTSTNDLIGQRSPNGLISVDCTNTLSADMSVANTSSSHGKDYSELHNANLQDQKIPISSSGTCSSEMKNGDFLTLSAGSGVGRLEPVNSNISNSNQGGVRLMSPAQGQANCQLPADRCHPVMSFCLSGVQSVSPQSQIPPCYLPALSGQGICTRQQLEQQQNQVWAAQLASQCRTGGNSGAHLPRWQNGGHDSPCLIPCTQPSYSSSPSSALELLNAKSSQQQQLFAFSSLPSSSVGKRDHHTFPRSYIEGGLQADASPHLQLVCGTEHV